MKIKHLFIFLTLIICGTWAGAQSKQNDLQVFNDIIFYDGYAKPVSFEAPKGLIRVSNGDYLRKLNNNELAAIGNNLTISMIVKAQCDNYDRIGKVVLYLVPKGEKYDSKNTLEIELMRIMTPFLYKTRQPDNIPYVADISQLAPLFHNKNKDVYIGAEIGGTTGAGQKEVIGCDGSILTFKASVQLISGEKKFKMPSNYKLYPLLNFYGLDGKDSVAGKNSKEVTFTIEKNIKNAVLYLISSAHGAGDGGEEYNWREHVLTMDGKEFKRLSVYQDCSMFEVYNTQPNGIYFDYTPKEKRSWCPGGPATTHEIDLGTLKAGQHTFKISVPDAKLLNNNSTIYLTAYLVAN